MLNRDFKEFIESLNAESVEYLVVGGYALAAHGVQLGYPPGRIDLVTGIDGVQFDACFRRRQVMRVGNLELPIIHVEDFKTNKRASGRLEDLADLEALEGDPET